VRVALDSAPQGATVTGAAGPLGKTPLLLNLPRSQEVVELTLTKPGYAPLPYKVIPIQDKDLVANLHRAVARTPAPVAAPGALKPGVPAGPAGTTKTVRVTTTTTTSSKTMQQTVAPAATTRAASAPPTLRR
jgi:hypothetical protein